MTVTTDNVIELHGVSKVYKFGNQEVLSLRSVDLTLKKGQIVALTGRSGAGKSTLLHLMGTLDKPTTGTVLINGTDVSTLNDAQTSEFRNSTIGFIFQANNLLPEFTALENVMMPGLIAGAPRKAVSKRAEELLVAVGLGQRVKHRPTELSGGEQQRVAIARALLMSPAILLCDEPTGNLDKNTSAAIQELLFRICHQRQTTMVLVTHDNDLAAKLPEQIVMEDGNILQ